MSYDFDEVIDRNGTDAVKTDALRTHWHRTDLIPMWVADMDFRTPSCVTDTIRQQLERGILGYTLPTPHWHEAIVGWLGRRHGWYIQTDRLIFSPGIVSGLGLAIQCFTQKGDKVMIQPPVYHPFFLVPQGNERQVVRNPLRLQNGQWQMDFDSMEAELQGCKLFILCNPHNPGGRVWTADELREVARLCRKHQVLVVADEIHADLTLPPNKFTPFATVSEDARLNSVTFMAASKTFNMAGLTSSYCIIEDDALRQRFRTYLECCELNNGHIFAFTAVAAAYEQGETWLNELLTYLQGNIDYTERFLNQHTPLIRMIRPQASFLIFLDCRAMNLAPDELEAFFVDKAHLALNRGDQFGEEGAGFMRLNIGTPRAVLDQALHQLATAYKTL